MKNLLVMLSLVAIPISVIAQPTTNIFVSSPARIVSIINTNFVAKGTNGQVFAISGTNVVATNITGGTSVIINGTNASPARFTNTATTTFSYDGTNIAITATGAGATNGTPEYVNGSLLSGPINVVSGPTIKQTATGGTNVTSTIENTNTGTHLAASMVIATNAAPVLNIIANSLNQTNSSILISGSVSNTLQNSPYFLELKSTYKNDDFTPHSIFRITALESTLSPTWTYINAGLSNFTHFQAGRAGVTIGSSEDIQASPYLNLVSAANNSNATLSSIATYAKDSTGVSIGLGSIDSVMVNNTHDNVLSEYRINLRKGGTAIATVAAKVTGVGVLSLDSVIATNGYTGLSYTATADDPYGAGWNGSLVLPTKNAIYDRIESIVTNVVGTVNEISVAYTNPVVTISLAPVVDLTSHTLKLPNSAAPSPSTFGEIAGDNNAWAASHGALAWWDGTSVVWTFGMLASDIPVNGQVPKYNNGIVSWDDDLTGSGAPLNGTNHWTATNLFDTAVIGDRFYATNGFFTIGSSAGGITLYDDDASASWHIGANGTMGTNGWMTFPANPDSGIPYFVLNAATNAPMSILKHPAANGKMLYSTNSGLYFWGDPPTVLSDTNVALLNGTNIFSTTNKFSRLEVTTTNLFVLEESYDATRWDGNATVPTKNSIRDKIESLTVLWNGIGDASNDGSIDFNETGQIIGGSILGTNSFNRDMLTIAYTNSSSGDILTQRVLVVKNATATGGTTEVILGVVNEDGSAVPTGILVDTTGVMTNAIDVSDPQIINALSAGANDLIGTSWSITGSSGAASFGPLTVAGTTNGTWTFYDGGGTKYTTIGAAPAVLTNSVIYFPVQPGTGLLYASDTGTTNTNGATILQLSWTNVSSGSAPAGTVINTGASVVSQVPRYTDTSGTNVAPSTMTVATLGSMIITNSDATNISFNIKGPSGGTNNLVVVSAGGSNYVTINSKGQIFGIDGTSANPTYAFINAQDTGMKWRNPGLSWGISAVEKLILSASAMTALVNIDINASATPYLSVLSDTYIGREAVSIWQLGLDLATPLAQTLKGPDGVGTDKIGGNVTLGPGRPTGTGTIGRVLVAVATNSTSTGSAALNYGTSVTSGGTLKVDTTTTGNVGGGEDNLISYAVPGAELGVNGDYIEWKAWGSFAANANTKQLKIYFGSTVLIDTTALVLNGVDWKAHGEVVRTGAATQTASTELTIGGTLLSALNSTIADVTAPTETLSANVTFKCTGTDSGGVPADNNIVQNGLIVKWFGGQ